MRRKIEEERYKECQFKPNISKTSNALAFNPNRMN